VCVQEDAQEEFGWKLVHGDVFRPPRKGMLLSVFLGNGLQMFFMTVITLGMSNVASVTIVISTVITLSTSNVTTVISVTVIRHVTDITLGMSSVVSS